MRWLIICTLLWYTTSCNKDLCPSDKNVGSISLSEDTKSFNPYIGSTTLTFTNIENDTIKLHSSGLVSGTSELCVKIVCREPLKYGGGVSCETMTAQHQRFTFKNSANTLLFELNLYFENLQSEAKTLYEVAKINMSSMDGSGIGDIITHNHTSYNVDSITATTQPRLKLRSSMVRKGKTYYDVYTNEGSDDTIIFYFTKLDGLIGWDAAGHQWTIVP